MSQNQAHNCGAPDPTSPPLAASLREQLVPQLLRKHEELHPSIAAPAASSLGGLARGMGVQGAGSLGLACRDGSGTMCLRAQDLVGYQLYSFPNSPGTRGYLPISGSTSRMGWAALVGAVPGHASLKLGVEGRSWVGAGGEFVALSPQLFD